MVFMYNLRMSKKKKSLPDNTIAQNKKARHDFFIEDTFEAGLVLEGWEVKSLRAGRIQMNESYIMVRNSELWWIGMSITPLLSASTHITPDHYRSRKLLMQRREIDKIIGAVERKGYTLVPLSAYWVRGKAKLKIGLAKGKKDHDKRATDKDRDWKREKQRILKSH